MKINTILAIATAGALSFLISWTMGPAVMMFLSLSACTVALAGLVAFLFRAKSPAGHHPVKVGLTVALAAPPPILFIVLLQVS